VTSGSRSAVALVLVAAGCERHDPEVAFAAPAVEVAITLQHVLRIPGSSLRLFE